MSTILMENTNTKRSKFKFGAGAKKISRQEFASGELKISDSAENVSVCENETLPTCEVEPSSNSLRLNWRKRKKIAVRGWPVVATGAGGIMYQRSYAAWRGHIGFPEESPDFSDNDVFDVAFFLIAKVDARQAATARQAKL